MTARNAPPVDLENVRAALDPRLDLYQSDRISIVMNAAPALVSELAAARAEIARLMGFEPCRAKMTDVDRETFETAWVTCRIPKNQHENASRNVHPFVGGAFDAEVTTEVK